MAQKSKGFIYGMLFPNRFQNFHNGPSEDKTPKLFVEFFRWLCNIDFQEEIEGDLFESCKKYSERFGKEKAKWFFIKEVLFPFGATLIGNINQFTNINSTIMITKNRRLIGIMATITGLLFIPLIAMQFSKEVNWGVFDFIVMGILLLSAGFSCELVLRKVKTIKNRIIICGAVLFVLLLVWAELAVGIFGTPFAGN